MATVTDNVRFQDFRGQLLAKGVTLRLLEEPSKAWSVWQVQGANTPCRIVVQDAGQDGFYLFPESRNIRIDKDVADLAGETA